MQTIEEVRIKVSQGKKLLLAGNESLLRQIPPGNWIGGTIPYFMTSTGGLTTKELIFVTELPEYILDIQVKVYDSETISQVYTDAPNNGFSIIIIPAKSSTHFSFALNVPNYTAFATRPLIGWISGIHLDDFKLVSPKVFNGVTAEEIEDGAIVMHVHLPANKVADIGILNFFEQGDGDNIKFSESGFSAKEAIINGVQTDFHAYLQEQQLDKRLPLVANYYGAMLNTAFQEEISPEGAVQFYNAVFNFLEYRHARPVQNYRDNFTKKISSGLEVHSVFSCNCVLNYFYANLEGQQVGCAPGPATFGEIAYQTLNQTLTYLRIIEKPASSFDGSLPTP